MAAFLDQPVPPRKIPKVRLKPIRAVLLLLSLLLGQWVALAHAGEHGLQSDKLHPCKTCLQYQNLANPAPASSAAPPAVPFTAEAPSVQSRISSFAAHRAVYQSRA